MCFIIAIYQYFCISSHLWAYSDISVVTGVVQVHDLRHSYASRALAAGESLSMIGKLLGHADIQSTARYAHLARETERVSAARVGASIGADIAPAAGAGKDGAP